jgi:hypothetical protein
MTNLETHAEEGTLNRFPDRGRLHGVQRWTALPDADRAGERAFEHVADVPSFEVDGALVRVFMGTLGGVTSPVRAYTPLDAARDSAGEGTRSHPVGESDLGEPVQELSQISPVKLRPLPAPPVTIFWKVTDPFSGRLRPGRALGRRRWLPRRRRAGPVRCGSSCGHPQPCGLTHVPEVHERPHHRPSPQSTVNGLEPS